MLLPCEQMYGTALGGRMQESLEAALDQPCPCKRSLPCLLVLDDGALPSLPRQVAPSDLPLTA